MKKNIECKIVDIELGVIDEYKKQIIIEMEKMGASNRELLLIQDATIRNAIKRKRKPEDVAWAILQ